MVSFSDIRFQLSQYEVVFKGQLASDWSEVKLHHGRQEHNPLRFENELIGDHHQDQDKHPLLRSTGHRRVASQNSPICVQVISWTFSSAWWGMCSSADLSMSPEPGLCLARCSELSQCCVCVDLGHSSWLQRDSLCISEFEILKAREQRTALSRSRETRWMIRIGMASRAIYSVIDSFIFSCIKRRYCSRDDLNTNWRILRRNPTMSYWAQQWVLVLVLVMVYDQFILES